jgi:DNA-binding transcriptional ArsR family regulator
MKAKEPGAGTGPNAPAADPKTRVPPDRERRNISDPRTIRAVAHPMRIAILEALRREGPLTATRAAELLDDSPGNMSWHMQTLAKYGYIEEAGGGRGRSRPWQAVTLVYNFEESDNPEQAAAGEALDAVVQERNYGQLRQWWSQRRSYSVKWRRASFNSRTLTYVTADELRQLGEDLNELLLRYKDRTLDKSRRPPDALPIQLVAYGHPLPPTPTGN